MPMERCSQADPDRAPVYLVAFVAGLCRVYASQEYYRPDQPRDQLKDCQSHAQKARHIRQCWRDVGCKGRAGINQHVDEASVSCTISAHCQASACVDGCRAQLSQALKLQGDSFIEAHIGACSLKWHDNALQPCQQMSGFTLPG